jgi:hypothetical protein
MTTRDVSIRLSIQDAETVRVALEKLGTDGQAALKKIETASAHPSAGLGALDKSVASAKSSIKDLGSELGPVGSLLMGLGPIGITVAAGLGGALLVMHEMSKEANALAERAEGIRTFAEITGFTTAQVQALTAEGTKFNVSNEQLSGGLQHLAVNLDQAHRAQGSLYQDLERVNPKLADQVAAAKDVASAYDLIGRAIAQATAAGNTSEAAAVARAAFGRNFGGQGALAADVAGQGGPNSLAATYVAAGKALDDGLLKRLTELAKQNAQLEQQTKDIWASMYSEDVLRRANEMDKVMLNLAQHAKELHDATKDEGLGDWFRRTFAKMGAAQSDAEAGTNFAEQIDNESLYGAARRRLAARLQSGERSNLDQVWRPKGDGTDQGAPKIPNPDPEGNLFTAAEHLKQFVAVLGGAATPAEQLKARIAELNAQVKDHPALAQAAARAEQFLKQSQTEAAASARERLGVASQEEIFSAKKIQLLREEVAAVNMSEAEKQAAIARTARAAEQAFRQEQINNSAFKGLAAVAHPDMNASIDQLATGTLNSLDTTLVSVINHTQQGSEAWKKFGLNAIGAIESSIIKMAIFAPILRGIETMLAGSLSGGVGSGGKAGLPFAMGGIMTPRGSLPLHFYEGGGIATGPQMAIFGEGRQNEAYVPLPDGRAIPVNMKGAGGGGGVTVHGSLVTVNVHAAGALDRGAIEKMVDTGSMRAVSTAAALIRSSNEGMNSRLMMNDARGIG